MKLKIKANKIKLIMGVDEKGQRQKKLACMVCGVWTRKRT
jgi:ABC-type uncharacterized transport system ATPase subunit